MDQDEEEEEEAEEDDKDRLWRKTTAMMRMLKMNMKTESGVVYWSNTNPEPWTKDTSVEERIRGRF